jgi:aspartyl-tRNA synthetase
MIFTKRTHTCGELRAENIENRVTLNGWVDGHRNLGGMLFVDMRDRYGLTQVVFAPQYLPDLLEQAKELRSEFVVSVTGTVRHRGEGHTNPNLPTGEVEVVADSLEILTRSEVPPFEITDDVDANEDLRLKYRYLDLRRPILQKNFMLRHRLYQIVHRYFDRHGFLEIETPVLMKSTPEGARDYLVPSRIHHGKFYALPQSPQTYKQLLMVSGFDRYVQIVKCFRDEDLRADRQPEFTQIDVEMSFVQQDDVLGIIEGLIAEIFTDVLGREFPLPIPRMDYNDAIASYGSDKPDLRFGMPIVQLSDTFAGSEFKVFADVVAQGGIVAGLRVEGRADHSRKQLDTLTQRAKDLGLGGLSWMKVGETEIQSPIAKFLSPDALAAIRSKMGAEPNDLLLIAGDTQRLRLFTALGALRLELGRDLGLIAPDSHALLWVVNFPLFQYDAEQNRWLAEHHAFTGPKADDLPLLDSDPGEVHADCYDLVWNGSELASGSIRIHDSALQAKVFSIMGLEEADIREKFGYLLDAFKYGAPPHGGIALGLDRMVTILAGLSSIRDVIAFPKTNSALSLMDSSPSPVSEDQLKELHITIRS